jgi:hypothetical protein
MTPNRRVTWQATSNDENSLARSAADVYYAREIIGEHVQCHLSATFGRRFIRKRVASIRIFASRTDAQLSRAEFPSCRGSTLLGARIVDADAR